MKHKKLFFTVEKGQDGYGAYCEVKDGLIATRGDTLAELKHNILEAANLHFEDSGQVYTADQIEYGYDLASFFAFYREINAAAFAARVGMSQSLLSQYIHGIKTPSHKQVARIMDGIRALGKEMAELEIVG